MNILISCLSFKNYTGSEMSVYELSRELVRQGHDVSIIAPTIGLPLQAKAEDAGVRVYPYSHPPTPVDQFDILHLNHKPISEQILRIYPDTPAVMHVRSEVIPIYEVPIIHPMIKKYITIRPTITKYIKTFGITEDEIVHIDNPFDTDRFNYDYDIIENENERILFVGTLDYLRYNVLMNLITSIRNNGKELWIIGADSGYAKELIQYHNVTYLGVQPDVEKYIKQCDYTAGIFNGRTTIEGWLCGVPAYIYQVNREGKILSKRLVEPPMDLIKYSAENSTAKVLELYSSIIN